MKTAKNLLSLIMVLVLSGCASAPKLNKVQVGMTKDQVVAIMGAPVSTSAQGNGWEYLNYSLTETFEDAHHFRPTPYYVRLVNGRVESFGRTGDFDSTQKPTMRIETDSAVRTDSRVTTQSDLSEELQKLKALRDDGTITEDEFQKAKQKLLSR